MEISNGFDVEVDPECVVVPKNGGVKVLDVRIKGINETAVDMDTPYGLILTAKSACGDVQKGLVIKVTD